MLKSLNTLTESQYKKASSLLFNINYDDTEKTLKKCLKAMRGKGQRRPKRKAIRELLFYATECLNIIRGLPVLVNELQGLEFAKSIDEQLLDFDYNEADHMIYSGLQDYIFEHHDSGRTCADYLLRAQNIFQKITRLIKTCETFFDQQLEMQRQLKGASNAK